MRLKKLLAAVVSAAVAVSAMAATSFSSSAAERQDVAYTPEVGSDGSTQYKLDVEELNKYSNLYFTIKHPKNTKYDADNSDALCSNCNTAGHGAYCQNGSLGIFGMDNAYNWLQDTTTYPQIAVYTAEETVTAEITPAELISKASAPMDAGNTLITVILQCWNNSTFVGVQGDPIDPNADPNEYWKGSMDLGWVDGTNVLKISSGKFSNLEFGDSLKFTLTGSGTTKMMDGSWAELASHMAAEGYETEYNTVPIAAPSYTLKPTEADVAALKSSGFIMGGTPGDDGLTITKVERVPAGGGEVDPPVEKTITIDPETLNLTVGLEGTITATTTPADATVTWESSDTGVATVKDGVVTGVAAGEAIITATIEGTEVKKTCTVTVKEEDVEADTPTLTIDETKTVAVGGTVTITATKTNSEADIVWTSSDETKATVANGVVTGVAAGEVTITAALDGVTPAVSDTCTVTVTAAGEDDPEDCTHEHKTWASVNAETHKWVCSDCEGEGAPEAHTFTNNVCTVCGYEREEGGNTPEPSEGSVTLEMLNENWAEKEITQTQLIGDMNVADIASITVTSPAAIKIGYNNHDNTYTESTEGTSITLNASDIAWGDYFYFKFAGSMTEPVTVSWTITPVTVTPSHEHSWSGTWTYNSTSHWHTCSGCDEVNDTASHSFTTTVSGDYRISVCVCGYSISEYVPSNSSDAAIGLITGEPNYSAPTTSPVPNSASGSAGGVSSSDSGSVGWTAVSKDISAAVDSGESSVSIDMNGTNGLPKDVVKEIAGTDVDLVVNLSNGVKWTINGKDVTNAKSVNLGVTVGKNNIPAKVIETVSSDNNVKQLNLKHSGEFGFTATMTIDLGAKNNGKYANLFYYNPKSRALEFVDCAKIDGGSANLMFSHASDYAIVIEDEPLGTYEDVSAAAGITSADDTVDAGNAAIFFAGGASVLAIAAVITANKRRQQR